MDRVFSVIAIRDDSLVVVLMFSVAGLDSSLWLLTKAPFSQLADVFALLM